MPDFSFLQLRGREGWRLALKPCAAFYGCGSKAWQTPSTQLQSSALISHSRQKEVREGQLFPWPRNGESNRGALFMPDFSFLQLRCRESCRGAPQGILMNRW